MAKRKARSLDDHKLPLWKFVVFTDLHVQAATLDRALEVLRRVGALAQEHGARILCLGDFWDLRGSLQIRQVDAVMAVLDDWQRQGLEAIFIPGNHDQVTVNGRVHGVRVFEGYPNITVATEPVQWPERKIAFLPWREDPAEQAALFREVPGGWTIFAHAEAPGAISNSGKKMAGRFEGYYVEETLRRIYLGHFHKRHQPHEGCWYIGSPFEMDFGERGEPHGVAIIEEGKQAPTFIDWDDFPKHHRLTYGEKWQPKYIRPGDVVEVHAAPEEIGSAEFAKALTVLQAEDVRPLPVKNGKGEEAPAFAITLNDAVEQWIAQAKLPAAREAKLLQLGRELLAQASDAAAIVPLATKVSVQSVDIQDFCAVRGNFVLDMPMGEALIRGPMGIGKTSMMDAVTWCFFGSTTPRKAGSHGASLKADEVVHDDASACRVSVVVRLNDDEAYDVTITRTKKRNQGAKIEISGIAAGISDQQQQIHNILGIDHDLWRTCVYLGQGAVGTFVTDADKRRKDLLATAFGLNACAPAQKLARDRWKQLAVKVEKLRRDITGDERVIEALQETDYREQIEQWALQLTAQLEQIRGQGEAATAIIEQCDQHLAQEDAWLQSKAKHEAHIDRLTKSLVQASPKTTVANLQRELGGLQAERAMVERDLGLAKQALTQHIEGPTMCPTCGKPFDAPSQEQHAEALESKVLAHESMVQSFDVRISNVAMKLDAANSQTSAESDGIQNQILESRESLRKCGEALNTFTRLKANKADAERRRHEARAQYAAAEQSINPYHAKQAEKEDRIKTLTAKLRADEAELEGVQTSQKDYSFWEQGFGAKGLPVLVLRAALHELELYANKFMAALLHGRVYCQLSMEEEDLKILFFEYDDVSKKPRPRRYEQLSGGQRRCVELAFNPFALSEMIFSRCGVRFSMLVVDELTTHLGQAEKPLICDLLRSLERDSIIVIDHDQTVQGMFDTVLDLTREESGHLTLQRTTT
jgi:DNA repair exonuclease SbcCD ATPase subunit